MAKTPKRPRDPNQLAKLITDIATGETEDDSPKDGGKGRAGGLVGGKARAKALDHQTRQQIAQKAANARWAKKPD